MDRGSGAKERTDPACHRRGSEAPIASQAAPARQQKEDGVWHLAPAYDLTGVHFSDGDAAVGRWQNQHALSVNGKFSGITDDDLLAVADKYAIGTAPRVLAAVHHVLDSKK